MGRVPAIFGGNTLYATGALIAAIEMAVLYHLGLRNVGMAVAIVSAAVICTVARRRGWRLPGPGELSVRLPRRQRSKPAAPGEPGTGARREPGWPRPRFNRIPRLRSGRRNPPEPDGDSAPMGR